ncbi:MAG: hypothetical protein BWK79_12475, partial [Beggiatoa sp. IS2]
MFQRYKLYLILGFLVVTLIGFLHAFSATALRRGITQLEDQSVQQQLGWIRHVLTKDLEELEGTALELASRPDIYQNDFSPATFAHHQLNFIMVIQPTAHQVRGQIFNLENQQMTAIPDEVRTQLSIYDFFPEIAPSPEPRHTAGVFSLGQDSLLLAVVPIKDTSDDHSLSGTLIIGRSLAETLLKTLTDWTRVTFAIYQQNATHLPEPVQIARQSLSEQRPVLTQVQDAHTMTSYTLMKTLNPQINLILQMTHPRPFYRESQTGARYLLGSLVLMGFILGGFALWLASRLVQLERVSTEQLEQELHTRQRTEATLQKVNEELEQLSIFDDLTRIANRRRFEEYLHQEWRRLSREKQPLSVVFCDIDYFKSYQDEYGQEFAGACLQKIAQATQRATRRPADLTARYGGEWFAVILPNTDAKGAFRVALNIRMEVRQLEIVHHHSPISEFVTLSMGVSSIIPAMELKPETLVTAADKALQEAKKQG